MNKCRHCNKEIGVNPNNDKICRICKVLIADKEIEKTDTTRLLLEKKLCLIENKDPFLKYAKLIDIELKRRQTMDIFKTYKTRDLAAKLHLSERYIRALKQKTRKPSFETIAKIKRALGISYQEIMEYYLEK